MALAAVENGDAYAALIFPEDFTATALSRAQSGATGSSATIELLLDKSNKNQRGQHHHQDHQRIVAGDHGPGGASAASHGEYGGGVRREREVHETSSSPASWPSPCT